MNADNKSIMGGLLRLRRASSEQEENIRNIFYAVGEGHLDIVRSLVKKGVDFNVMNGNGDYPLHWAVLNDHLGVVKYLVEQGADFNVKNKSGNTPLHWSAQIGILGIVKYLVEKGADLNVKNSEADTPLSSAIAFNSGSDVIKFLMEKGNIRNIFDAAKNGNLDAVKYFVKNEKIDVNVKDNDGDIPLHWAVWYGHSEIVKYFVEKGANFNIKNRSGNTPLYWSAWNGELGIVKYLIEKGANLNVKNNEDLTPLQEAARNGHLNVVKYLVEKGADFNNRNNYNSTPLHDAAWKGHLDVVKYFIDEKHADFNVKNNGGNTPLHDAAREGFLNVVKYLVENGADFNAKTKDGQTPLCVAVQYNRLSIINFLLGKGTNVEASVFNDNTVLNQAHCIKELMKKTNNKLPFDIEELKNKLPKSVKNLVFASKVCIINAHFNEYLYAASDSTNYDGERRRVFTWIPSSKNDSPGSCGNDMQGMWKIQLDGNYACITNVHFNEYLYNAGDSFNYDGERRRLFTWIPSSRTSSPGSCGNDMQGTWKIQPNGNYVCITNVHFNEYLYTANDSFNYDKERRRVFTWIPSRTSGSPGSCGNDMQGLWRIEDCSSVRKKRDIEELDGKMSLDSNFLEAIGTRSKLNDTRTLALSGRLEDDQLLDDSNQHIRVEVADTKDNEERENPIQRKLHYLAKDSSNQPEIATSSGARTSSWMNDLFGWMKGSVGGLFGSGAALPEETLNTTSSISQIDAPMDVNSAIMLFDLLIRRVTGQKYISIVDQPISPLEAQGYALNIANRFEKVLNETAIKSSMSVANLNFDPVAVQSAIVKQIISEKFSKIPETLYSFAEEACPEFQQTDEFLIHLRSQLEVEKETALLQWKVEKPSKTTLDQQVSRKLELSKKPDTFLNGTSVVKGISSVIER